MCLEEKSLSELQKSGKDIQLVRRLLDSKEEPGISVISSASPAVKALWSQRQILVIKNDMLYRKWEDQKNTLLQAIILLSERRKVLSYCYDHVTSGHLGIKKT